MASTLWILSSRYVVFSLLSSWDHNGSQLNIGLEWFLTLSLLLLVSNLAETLTVRLPFLASSGGETQCPAQHFRNMRLVLNTAFCGSVAGNRFQFDCKNQSQSFQTCNAYIKSEPEELNEAYWKIRGVYVYQRAWRQVWLK
jgi:hypothetical protein